MRAVWIVLAAYLLGFALFLPAALQVVDEDRYVSQALAFAQGRTVIPGSGIIIPESPRRMISDYPPGTSLLQTPLVWAFGWRGASLASVICLMLATLFTALWLRGAGKSPAYALFVPGFLAAALFGRIAMSDVPAAALTALFCWGLWRTHDNRPWASLALGATAGAMLLFREPQLVLLTPLAAVAVVRRRVSVLPAAAGLLCGVVVRLALADAFFGDPLYVRDPGIGFSAAALRHTLPLYAVVLLVMFPAGAVWVARYRGERRPELVAAVSLYVALFLFYDYDAIQHQGALKGFMVGARFMIPIAPLLAWMAADALPRTGMRYGNPSSAALGTVLATVVAFGVHPLASLREREARGIATRVMEHTSAASPVITNSDATLRYLGPAYGQRRLILRQAIDVDAVPALLKKFGSLTLVLLNRRDSEYFEHDARDNDRFRRQLASICLLQQVHEAEMGWVSLHIDRIQRCDGSRRAP